MSQENEWDSGICGCGESAGTCLGAWCCPCFLFGRTAQRLNQFPSTEKPDLCDTNCAILCFSSCCHLQWIPTLLKRMDVRNKFGIKGNGCVDCLASYFCFPCTLAQMEAQVRGRALMAQGNPAAQGYVQQQQGMVYQPPPHGQYQQPEGQFQHYQQQPEGQFQHHQQQPEGQFQHYQQPPQYGQK